MFICLPGSRGKAKAAVGLNIPEKQPTRSQIKSALEDAVRRLNAHAFVPYVIEHSGNDVST
jgi:hypothetical protein